MRRQYGINEDNNCMLSECNLQEKASDHNNYTSAMDNGKTMEIALEKKEKSTAQSMMKQTQFISILSTLRTLPNNLCAHKGMVALRAAF